MTFSVIIPARFASTRLPGKPLLDIGGRTMIQRVVARACASSASEVLVATDDARIAAAVRDPRRPDAAIAVLTDPDLPSGTDRVAAVAEARGWDDDTVVVNVQGDEPLIDPALIDAVAALLRERPEAAMSTAAHPIGTVDEFTNPNVVKVVLDARQLALYFSRAPIPWWRDGYARGVSALPSSAQAASGPVPLRHIGIYGYRAGFLRRFPGLPQAPAEVGEALEQLRVLWHGHRIAVHVTDQAPGPGVDTPEDLARVRQWFAS